MRQNKLYVGDLLENVNKDDLEKEFSRFGRLTDVWVAHNPPGFAFVEYEDDRDASKAVRALDGKHACGSKIRVEISRKGVPAGRGRGRGGMSRGGGRGGYGGTRSPPMSSRTPFRRPLSPPRGRSPPSYRGRSPPSYRTSAAARRHSPVFNGRQGSPPRRRMSPGPIRRPLSPLRPLTPPRRMGSGRDRMNDYDRYASLSMFPPSVYDIPPYRDDSHYRDESRMDSYTTAYSSIRSAPATSYRRSRSPISRRRSPAGMAGAAASRSFGGRDRTLDRGRPVERGRPPMDRSRPPMDRSRPPMDRSRPPMDRSRPPMDRSRPPMDRGRPPMDRATFIDRNGRDERPNRDSSRGGPPRENVRGGPRREASGRGGFRDRGGFGDRRGRPKMRSRSPRPTRR